MVIDAHHHFWKYDPVEYDWIDDGMSSIRRDFLPPDLQKAITSAGVDGVVSVQARQSLEETTWLLDFALHHAFIQGVVGWIPLISDQAPGLLEGFCRNSKFRSVRHVLQGEPDEYMHRPDFNRGIALLKNFDLAYDLLIVERQLPAALEFVDRHPDLTIILDHVAKPRIGQNELEPWAENLARLAKRENVYCKVSGMVTEADFHTWTPSQLRPYFDVVLEAFGPNRLLFGSDWPVCLVACEYPRWVRTVRDFASELSGDEQRNLFGETARRVYKL